MNAIKNAIGLALTYVMAFVALALALGLYIRDQSRQKAVDRGWQV